MDIQLSLAAFKSLLAYTGLCGGVISSAPSPEPGSPLVLFSFFHFMRRFWNLISDETSKEIN